MPFPLVIDANLQLSPVRESDAEGVFAETDRSRRFLRQWLPWLDGVQTVEDTRKFIGLAIKKRRERQGLTLVIRFQGTCAGIIDLHEIDNVNRCAKMGYWLGESFQGRGLMTRAAEALVFFAFDEMSLNRLEVRVAPENLKSRAIPQRLGFLLEGKLLEAEWLYHHFVDHEVYGMTRRRWKGLYG